MFFWFKSLLFFNFICDFSWEDGGTLPQNIYKPSWDLWEATLISSANSEIQWYTQKDRQRVKPTSCYCIIRKLCYFGFLPFWRCTPFLELFYEKKLTEKLLIFYCITSLGGYLRKKTIYLSTHSFINSHTVQISILYWLI